MKILILSDTHSYQKEKLQSLIQSIQPDHTIHCGDIYATHKINDLPNSTVIRGNNDNLNCPLDTILTLDNTTFYICHGHRHNVHFTKDELELHGNAFEVDIVCYGHTHIADYTQIKHLTILNPGSLVYPRGQEEFGSYCIFDTKTKKTTFYRSDTHKPFTINKN